MVKDFWAIVWMGLMLLAIPLFVAEHTSGTAVELSAMTEEVQEVVEPEDAEAVENLVLGLPFIYRLTEEGRQLLVESGLWERMLELVEDFGPERMVGDYGPELQLNDYVVFIVPKAVHFAYENGFESRAILGTAATGFQEIYIEMYGEP